MADDVAKRRARQRRYDQAHPEVCRAKYRRWYQRNRELNNERVKEWKQANPEKTRATLRRIQVKRRAFIDQIKADAKCMDCGGPVEHFHHRDPTTKRLAVGSMTRYSEESILAEVAKCDLLCGGCHRKRHVH
jgi:hypothetical protein